MKAASINLTNGTKWWELLKDSFNERHKVALAILDFACECCQYNFNKWNKGAGVTKR